MGALDIDYSCINDGIEWSEAASKEKGRIWGERERES